jgi:hypothetical protein
MLGSLSRRISAARSFGSVSISPGSIPARRREAKAAALVKSLALVSVAGAARNGAGILDVAFDAGSLLTGGISTGPSSLRTGLNRVNGGLAGGGG